MGISHELSEEDVKFSYINDAITSKGWTKDSIFMEQQVKFTDGKISLHGNIVHREKPKFADYVLYVNKATPIAIIEAKDTKHTVSYGLHLIVKTCSDIFYTIGQKKCPMPSAKIRNYSHSHNLMSK